MLFTGIKEIEPITPVAQTVSMIEKFLALFLIAIFAATAISFKSERYSRQLNEVIAGLNEDGRVMERFIRDEYSINSIEEALVELNRLKAGASLLLNFLTRSLSN